jgi:hypothetical protein
MTVKSQRKQRNKKGRQENWQGSGHLRRQEEAMIVVRWSLSMDQQKKAVQDFHEREKWKINKYGGWSEEGMDKMERLVKEIRLD